MRNISVDTKTNIMEFSSIQELCEYISTDKYNTVFSSSSSRCSDEKNYSFCQTESLSEAVSILKTGWSEKAKEIESKLSETLKEATPVNRQKSVYDVVGGNCSVPRYLQGVPTSMIRQTRVPVKQKVVTINKNISYACLVSADQIVAMCIECLQHVKALEDAGTRVNINIYCTSEVNDQTIGMRLPIKKSSERLNLTKIAFPVAHPSMLRRVFFSFMEHYDKVTSPSFIYGYGTPVRDKDRLKSMFPNEEFFD